MKSYKEKLRQFSQKENNMNKQAEISEKKQKEIDKLQNEVTVMKVKLE
jgi:hypothetical protein